MLTQVGIATHEGDIHSALGCATQDIILFEFYPLAREFMTMVRRMQPDARVVVDSVDVHYNRLQTKANLSGSPEDAAIAQRIRLEELATYTSADLVIVVSKEDENVILRDLPACQTSIIPNVHEIPPYPESNKRTKGELLFVGNFIHPPNVDAMLFFTGQVMPLVRQRIPGVSLTIIGNKPPEEIQRLAADDIKVLGYVPDISPFLQSAYISIAPLRYGGGIKGKVGEAMSFGLPVVTTSFGVEGFDLIPGQHAIVAETPEAMAAAIGRLMADATLYESVRRAGYELIQQRFSPGATVARIDEFMQRALSIRPKAPHLLKRLINQLVRHYHRYIGWRLNP